MSMWVPPDTRGRGVGDAAVRAIIEWAGDHYPDGPVLLSAKAANHPAIALYARHGFVDAGPRPDGSDELLMRREAVC